MPRLAGHPEDPCGPSGAAQHLDLRSALMTLQAEQRRALVLHHLVGLPVGDIALETGVAVGTVKSRLARWRATLAELLGPAYMGDGPDDAPVHRPDSPSRFSEPGMPFWTSADGLEWEQVDDVIGPPPRRVSHVAGAGHGFVATGTDRDGMPGVWTSADGHRWVRAETPSDPTIVLDGVVRTTAGWFGWAVDRTGGTAKWDPVIWRSTDACSWTPVGEPAGFSGPGDQLISWMQQDPDGGLLAWGPDRPLGGGQRLARWTSSDGDTSDRLPQGPEETWEGWCCREEILGGRYSATNATAAVWLSGLPYGPNNAQVNVILPP